MDNSELREMIIALMQAQQAKNEALFDLIRIDIKKLDDKIEKKVDDNVKEIDNIRDNIIRFDDYVKRNKTIKTFLYSTLAITGTILMILTSVIAITSCE